MVILTAITPLPADMVLRRSARHVSILLYSVHQTALKPLAQMDRAGSSSTATARRSRPVTSRRPEARSYKNRMSLRPMAYPFRALVGFPVHSSAPQPQLHMPQQLPH